MISETNSQFYNPYKLNEIKIDHSSTNQLINVIKTFTNNKKFIKFVTENVTLCKPDSVVFCDGSEKEYNYLCHKLVESKLLIPLKRPGSFLARSDPHDVARVESKTFVCSIKKEDSGPTNNWVDPVQMKENLKKISDGCMKGRTMYVIPFSMGPLDSDISKIGIEITDSAYVACSMKIMTRVSPLIYNKLGENGFFVECLHSVGKPILSSEDDVVWPCNPEKTASIYFLIIVAHFPEERLIWSFGSGYGGNALLGKKCLALRIASVMGRDEGWMAEHMLILGVTNPQGKKKYICAAFPSACGKTNLAMLNSTLPGWKFSIIGDDIAWMKFDKDGYLRAINPENGFFGLAPGTSMKSNKNAMITITKNTIFTNVGLTEDNDVWWEGLSKEKSNILMDWTGKSYDGIGKVAHGNSRFTAPLIECPSLDDEWDNPEGVKVSAILFGGRRNTTVPLVTQSFNWPHGVYMGSSISSEQQEASEERGYRHDPFAMLPFCGYNMSDYFDHWLKIGKMTCSDKLPKIFNVNWFRTDEKGRYLWPGYSENTRVLKWIFERTENENEDNAKTTPIGWLPKSTSLDLSGLDIEKEALEELLKFEKNEWISELEDVAKFYERTFNSKLPKEILNQLDQMKTRVNQWQQ
jgi:phosphoenolpyruvate carboxykinase (GTP)